jgi:hypothetical protein
MAYGVYWAMNKMVQRGVTGRYSSGSEVTFCAWFGNREADFILSRLEGSERTNRGREFKLWIGGVPVYVIYRTGMINGNIRVDIEWIDTDREKSLQAEEDKKKELQKEVFKFVMSSIRNKASDAEIKSSVAEKYGIEDFEKFLSWT